ncbi:fibronectin type III domain-containing protein [Listeria grandensis]|uniref:Fibronectin type III domain-containing protein n=1 Tax=Listeria grandensis TaxID=1494963 RepID=A0A7X1CPE0_9LIST|nr:fibronectin type III domain-containing protein [Listeria grandensis]MBC1935861.1 fibronectin type III domain-containing protein [Listeria grandensis]
MENQTTLKNGKRVLATTLLACTTVTSLLAGPMTTSAASNSSAIGYQNVTAPSAQESDTKFVIFERGGFDGQGRSPIVDMKVDYSTMKLSALSLVPPSTFFRHCDGNTYFSVDILSKDLKTVKASVQVTGSSQVGPFIDKLNNLSVANGDIIAVSQSYKSNFEAKTNSAIETFTDGIFNTHYFTVSSNGMKKLNVPEKKDAGFSLNLADESNGSSTWNLQWNQKSGEQYAVVRGDIPGGNNGKIKPHEMLGFTTKGTFQDKSGSFANYKLLTLDANGNITETKRLYTKSGLEMDTVAPAAPGNITALGGLYQTESKVGIRWNKSTDNREILSYQIYRDGELLKSVPAHANQATETFTDTNLKPGTAYTYTVTATDFAKNVSEVSQAITAKTKAAATVLTPADYTIGTTKYVTGSYTGDVAKMELDVDGVTYKGGTVADSKINFYAHGKIKATSKNVVVRVYDKNNNLLNTKPVMLKK